MRKSIDPIQNDSESHLHSDATMSSLYCIIEGKWSRLIVTEKTKSRSPVLSQKHIGLFFLVAAIKFSEYFREKNVFVQGYSP